MMYSVVLLFFFKQKTAYELRISDWSSDVCSSDLEAKGRRFRLGARGRKAVLYALGVLIVLFLVYYVVGIAVVHRIGDDTAFQPPSPTEGGSRAVDMAAALIGREVDVHGWTSHDPFLLPGYALDNLPNFQQGLFYALRTFAVEMGDQVGRARGPSQVDPDLRSARRGVGNGGVST